MSKSVYNSLDKKEVISRGAKIANRLNSKYSLGFVMPKERIARREFLKQLFDLNDGVFDEKYEEASTGSGKPFKDFDALHSSALCALLSFYNIKDLIIDGIHYDKAFFEVQNRVIKGRNPSNMDVVLVSKDNSTILFLECKFSEYISNKKQEVSNDYLTNCSLSKSLYDLLVSKELATIEPIKDEAKFAFKTKEAYSQGTKQVISHLVGIESFINRGKDYSDSFAFYSEKDQRRSLYKTKFKNIIFREVLFELEGYEKKLKNYISLSEKVRTLFIESGLIQNISFEPAITYQEIFAGDDKNNVGEVVKKYYKY